MATRTNRALLTGLKTLFNVGVIGELTDGQLLERFAVGRGEAGELAFAALVERHAAMVLRVCRSQLRDVHDTQDAFQATFLILVRRARSLWVRDSLGPWLYQVAFRTASCARTAKARRRKLEQRATEFTSIAISSQPADDSWERLLHEEIHRLPESYRVPIVLCDLQGHTCEEAARRMGRPVGTVKSWRSRGRERLRNRLLRLGLSPSAGLAAVLSAGVADARLHGLEDSAETMARRFMDSMTAGTVSASVSQLVKGMMAMIFLSKVRLAVVGIAVVAIAVGIGVATRADDGPKAVRPPTAQKLPPIAPPSKVQDIHWAMTLREAIRIGLRNSDVVRVIEPAKPGRDDSLTIAPSDAHLDRNRFRSEVMAHVRSVEQQYWNLSQRIVERWAAEMAVDLTEDILKREQARQDAGIANGPNLNEVKDLLERFKLDLIDKTANMITSERQLRNILGVVAADGRRIVPVTPPTETKPDVDWENSQSEMFAKQPDILRANQDLERVQRDGVTINDRGSIRRQQALRRQVITQTMQSLARFTLEIDSNYQLFETASRLRSSATQRLEAQRAFYEEGKITIDRYLDAVNRYAASIAQQAQYQAQYNASIAVLEEAKGTLLESQQIRIAEIPQPLAFEISGRKSPRLKSQLGDPMPLETDGPLPRKTEQTKPTTYTFQMTIGIGPKPIEIKGSLTVTPPSSTGD